MQMQMQTKNAAPYRRLALEQTSAIECEAGAAARFALSSFYPLHMVRLLGHSLSASLRASKHLTPTDERG